MKKALAFLAVLFLVNMPGHIYAAVVYKDNANVWDGFNINAGKDVMGVPDLAGVTFTYTGHSLSGIYIEYSIGDINAYNDGRQPYEAFAPGDWFFSIDDNEDWEYVLTTSSSWKNTLINTENKDWDALAQIRSETTWHAYDLRTTPLDYDATSSYVLASPALYPNGWTGRTDHPAYAVLPANAGYSTISFSGWNYENTGKPIQGKTYSTYWDLSANPLFLGNTGGMFTYGFSLNCANDVLYGQAPIPAPEPGTVLLLGAGLLGLAAASRRHNR